MKGGGLDIVDKPESWRSAPRQPGISSISDHFSLPWKRTGLGRVRDEQPGNFLRWEDRHGKPTKKCCASFRNGNTGSTFPDAICVPFHPLFIAGERWDIASTRFCVDDVDLVLGLGICKLHAAQLSQVLPSSKFKPVDSLHPKGKHVSLMRCLRQLSIFASGAIGYRLMRLLIPRLLRTGRINLESTWKCFFYSESMETGNSSSLSTPPQTRNYKGLLAASCVSINLKVHVFLGWWKNTSCTRKKRMHVDSYH